MIFPKVFRHSPASPPDRHYTSALPRFKAVIRVRLRALLPIALEERQFKDLIPGGQEPVFITFKESRFKSLQIPGRRRSEGEGDRLPGTRTGTGFGIELRKSWEPTVTVLNRVRSTLPASVSVLWSHRTGARSRAVLSDRYQTRRGLSGAARSLRCRNRKLASPGIREPDRTFCSIWLQKRDRPARATPFGTADRRGDLRRRTRLYRGGPNCRCPERISIVSGTRTVFRESGGCPSRLWRRGPV